MIEGAAGYHDIHDERQYKKERYKEEKYINGCVSEMRQNTAVRVTW